MRRNIYLAWLVILLLSISLAVFHRSYDALFFVALWFFPERMVGVVALSVYLFVWLPHSWGLPFMWHVPLLAVYMINPLPEIPEFRTWAGWDTVRRYLYPVEHAGNRPDLPKGTVAIYAIAPHGVYAENIHMGMVLNRDFADVVPVGASIMSWIPLAKDFCNIAGVIQATKQDMMQTLVERKRSILLVPEGIRGILYEKEPYLVPKRSGFVECAVEVGATIVPVYMHNVWSLYKKWPVMSSIEMRNGEMARLFNWLQHWMLSSCLKYPFLLCWGQFGGFFPLFSDVPIVVTYGTPIACEKISGADPRFDAYVKHIVRDYYDQQAILSSDPYTVKGGEKTMKKE
jgi:1-acyl-sn-glycerol-3-phosphate acyltransferase